MLGGGWRLAWLLAAALVGCGGGGDSDTAAERPAKPKGPPPAEQVEQSVAAILNTCIKRSFDDSADTSQVSAEVDRLIALFKRYDPDATLAQSDLRAGTLRQALTQVRDQVRDCSPADEGRINDTLTSSPPPAGKTGAVTPEPGDRDVDGTPEPGSGGRGVATIAAQLAPLCVERIGSGDTGPATPEIEGLVDDLVEAYRKGPKNTATRQQMRVARTNLRDGCGPDQAQKVDAALKSG